MGEGFGGVVGGVGGDGFSEEVGVVGCCGEREGGGGGQGSGGLEREKLDGAVERGGGDEGWYARAEGDVERPV